MTNKIVCITGAAKRIGAAMADEFHKNGYHILLHYHQSETAAIQLMNRLNAVRPHSVHSFSLNLHCIDKYKTIIKKAIDVFGRLDLLINNASSFYPTPIENTTVSEWDELQGSNLKAAFFFSQTCLPYLQKAQGNIINIIDIHGANPLRGYAAYCIAKAGLKMATVAMAKELAPSVRVNGISPGAILWPDSDKTQLSPEKKQQIIDKIPLQRAGEPADIAKAAYFLAEAQYITGQILSVDGGRSSCR